jgi:tol-pal system protein YbgF
LLFLFLVFPSLSISKDLPKIAIWDLVPRNISVDYAHQLTEIIASEIQRLGKYEVYSQENIRTIAGWEAQKVMLGCTDTKCLMALGQLDVYKLISGSIGKIGNRYSISLSLFDTVNVRAENKVSEFCNSEDELIELAQKGVRKLFGEKIELPIARGKMPIKAEEGIERRDKAAAEPDDAKLYKEAYNFFSRGDIEQAKQAFGKLLADHPSSRYAENAYYYLGECYFSQRRYEEATLAFDEVIKKYPKGNKVPDALYRQGLSFLEMKDETKGKLILKEVIRLFPQSDQAKRARKVLKEM